MKYTVNKEGPSDSFLKGCLKSPKISQYMAASAVTLGGFVMGTCLSWSSPSLPQIASGAEDLPVESHHLSWIGSILTVGAAVGSLSSGPGVELLGRKASLLISSFLFISGWICIAWATSLETLLLGRFITGLGVGSCSLVAPVYLAEMAQSEVRGGIGVAFQLMVVLGSLFSTVVGSTSGWRSLSLISSAVPGLFAIGVIFLPESPRSLMRKGKEDEALRALSWFRNSHPLHPRADVLEEFENMKECINASSSSSSRTFSSSLRYPNIYKPILITIALVLFNQLCGISAVNFYTVDIFNLVKEAKQFVAEGEGASQDGIVGGVPPIDSNLCAVIVQLVQILAVVLSSMLVDRVGRRALLLGSFGIMGASLGGLGATFYVASLGSSTYLPLSFVVLYNVGYSVGIGSLVWTVLSELLPSSIVGCVYSLETSFNWGLAFFITKYFYLLKETLDVHNTFWLFGGFCLAAGIIVFYIVPETRGKSLEEIQNVYFGGSDERRKSDSDSKADLVDPV